MIVGYEWFKFASGGKLPFAMPEKSAPRRKQQLLAFFASLERELEKVEFFRPPDKRETMQINLRNIFTRMQPTQQDIQTLHGVIMAIAEGRKGPARGGVLDGEEAAMLRALLAEHGGGRVPSERGPVRGLARLLRRNPTEARARAVAGAGQRPPLRRPRLQAPDPDRAAHLRFRVVPAARRHRAGAGRETAAAAQSRADKRAWLAARDYRVIELSAAEIAADIARRCNGWRLRSADRRPICARSRPAAERVPRSAKTTPAPPCS